MRVRCPSERGWYSGLVLAVMVGLALGMRPGQDDILQSDPPESRLYGSARLSQTPCIHVITFDRPKSLDRLLKQLNRLDYGDDTKFVRLTIAVDFPMAEASTTVEKGRNDTVAVAKAFHFEHGPKVVVDLSTHAGLIQQWLDAWDPEHSQEVLRPACLILEDDVVPSTFAWRWMREALAAYGASDRIASFSLGAGRFITASTSSRGLGKMPPYTIEPFLYRKYGTWGFVALPAPWTRFRQYMVNYTQKSSKHITFEGVEIWHSREHYKNPVNLWSYWFIMFMQDNNLFTLYPGLGACLTLCINMQEPGLHFSGKNTFGQPVQGFHLVKSDKERLHKFPDLNQLIWYDLDAKHDQDPSTPGMTPGCATSKEWTSKECRARMGEQLAYKAHMLTHCVV